MIKTDCFWYMLCDIIRKHSNTKATYKLHIKEATMISRIENKVAEKLSPQLKKCR